MSEKIKFSEFLFDKFTEWMKSQKEPKTIAEFAEAVGINRQTINKLMEKNSNNIPQLRTVNALAKVIGSDIYDFLGITKSEIDFDIVKQVWGKLPEPIRDNIVETVKPYLKQ